MAFVRWLKKNISAPFKFTAAMNESKAPVQWHVKCKKMGQHKGWPDIVIVGIPFIPVVFEEGAIDDIDKFIENYKTPGKAIVVSRLSEIRQIKPPPIVSFLEFKTKTGVMSDEQLEFQAWCEENNINHAVPRSVREAKKIVKTWGIVNAS